MDGIEDRTREDARTVEITVVPTESGEYLVDDLVMATGYDAITGPLVRLGIADAWKDGARSFLGPATAGFPNLFTVTGPLSATALTNVIRSIEHHVEWIVECLEHLRSNDIRTIEATTEAQDAWDEVVVNIGGYTFHREVASWYTGGNIEGKPRKLMMWVGGFDTYRQACGHVAGNDYEGFATVGGG